VIFPTLHLSNNLKEKKRKRKRNINIDLAVLPSHDIEDVQRKEKRRQYTLLREKHSKAVHGQEIQKTQQKRGVVITKL